MTKTYPVRCVRVSVIAEKGGVRYAKGMVVDSPKESLALLKKFCPDDEKERLITIMLNANHKPIGVNIASVGTLTASLVHPREVLRPLIVLGAAAFIMGHNHPSGDTNPSSEDRETTRRMSEAARILGIPMLDHIVFTVGSSAYYSFRAAGALT